MQNETETGAGGAFTWTRTLDPSLTSGVDATPATSARIVDVALEAAGMGAWRYTLDDKVCVYSARAQELYGLPSPHIVHDDASLTELLHPEDLGVMWEAVNQACDSQGSGRYSVEYRVRRQDGGWRWLSVWGLVEFEGEGSSRRAVAITGASRDVTDRRLGDMFAEGQKKALELVVNGAPLPEVLTFLTQLVERLSDQRVIASILYLDQEGRLRNGASPSLPGDYVAAVDGLMARAQFGTCAAAAATGTVVLTPDIENDPWWASIRHLPLALGLRAAWSQPIFARDGSVLGTFGTYFRECREPEPTERQVVEILARTAAVAIERARGEAALRESERKLQTLVGNLPGMAYRSSPEPPWHLTYASDGGLALSGHAAPALTAGDPAWRDLIHPDDMGRASADVTSALQAGQAFEIAYRVRHARGGTRWLLDRGRGLYDGAGRAVAFEGFVADISRQRDAEDALRETDRRKDEFIATLSHELRNPLAPLRTALHLLRSSATDPATRVRLVPAMERQVDQLVRLVDDLLEVSRISRGTLELKRQPVPVADVVSLAVETCDPVMRAAGHRLTVALPDTPVWIHGDHVRLSQILSNLLNNAAKYTEPGGQITLEGRVDGRSVSLTVRDSGAGIEPDALPRLFDLFVRGTQSSRHGEGLGIGLALARRLAEMHGGTVTGSSAGPGQGSAFTLRLPTIAAPSANPAAGNADGAPGTAVTARVLVVDDNVDAADLTALLLDALGCETYRAYSGQAALETAARVRPDLILLDIGLPDANGYDVCRQLRGFDWAAQTAIVALTGWGQARDREASRAAGFTSHLVKPVGAEALAALVRGR